MPDRSRLILLLLSAGLVWLTDAFAAAQGTTSPEPPASETPATPVAIPEVEISMRANFARNLARDAEFRSLPDNRLI